MNCAAQSLEIARNALRDAALSARDPNAAIEFATMYGRVNWRNNDGLLSDEDFEISLLENHRRHLVGSAASGGWCVDWLHVVSEVYDAGGHTQLLERLALELLRRGASQRIVVTRHMSLAFSERARAAGLDHIELAGDHVARCRQIISLGRQARVVVLHLHPDDMGAAWAARILLAEGITVLFVNHADHSFLFGTGAATAVLEVSGFGWVLSHAHRPIVKHGYLGIPVARPSTRHVYRGQRSGHRILSIGNSRKYIPGVGHSFSHLLGALLPRTSVGVEVIGPDRNAQHWASLIKRFPGRLHLPGVLPYEVVEQRYAQALCYVDSMPVTGGTVFSQALMAGLPVFGLAENGGGYGLTDALRFEQLDDLVSSVLTYLETGIEPPEQNEVRTRLVEYSSVQAVTDRLERAASGSLVRPTRDLLRFGMGLDYYTRAWKERGFALIPLAPAGAVTVSSRMQLFASVLRGRCSIIIPWNPAKRLRWLLSGHWS